MKRFFQSKYLPYLLTSIVVVLAFIVFVLTFMQKIDWNDDKYPPKYIYFNTHLKAIYQDETIDTFNVNVYQNLDNVFLANGDLIYQRANPNYIYSGDNIANRITLCSNVKKFYILSSKQIIIPR